MDARGEAWAREQWRTWRTFVGCRLPRQNASTTSASSTDVVVVVEESQAPSLPISVEGRDSQGLSQAELEQIQQHLEDEAEEERICKRKRTRTVSALTKPDSTKAGKAGRSMRP